MSVLSGVSSELQDLVENGTASVVMQGFNHFLFRARI